MTKRLARAKAKLHAAGLRFEEPTASDMPQRLHALPEAIYAAYFSAEPSRNYGSSNAIGGHGGRREH